MRLIANDKRSTPMSVPQPTSRRIATRVTRVWRRVAAVAAVAVLTIASAAALAAGGTRVVGAASNSMLGETVVVDTHGRTLYALHPETAHHLLCKSHECFEAWPPLTVRSTGVKLTAGQGIEGHLGVLRRSDGKVQVTLRGMPLYRFSGDSAKGEANGEGIKSFGGTWHAVKASSHAAMMPSASPPANTPSPTPPYGY